MDKSIEHELKFQVLKLENTLLKMKIKRITADYQKDIDRANKIIVSLINELDHENKKE